MSTVSAVPQPLPTPPTTASASRRTSSRNTSLNSASPEIWRSPRTVTPGASIGTMNIVSPRCLGTSGSVRASSSPKLANWALVVHTFWPLSDQLPSSCRRARVWMAARSEPAAGSENSWHHTSSPCSIGPRWRLFCSSLPWAIRHGPSIPMPITSRIPGTPARAISWLTITCSIGPRPWPPYSRVPCRGGAWWRCSSSQRLTVARYSACSGVSFRSMSAPGRGSISAPGRGSISAPGRGRRQTPGSDRLRSSARAARAQGIGRASAEPAAPPCGQPPSVHLGERSEPADLLQTSQGPEAGAPGTGLSETLQTGPEQPRSAIRVLVVDDHDLFRAGLSHLLAAEPDIEVVAQASGGRGAVRLANELHPDVVLMDLRMADLSGDLATRAIIDGQPTARVVILTVLADDGDVEAAMRAGACGFLAKDTPLAEIIAAVRAAALGAAWLSPHAAEVVLSHMRTAGPERALPPDLNSPLTPRELVVLKLIACGMANAEIAAALGISPRTAKNHVSNILSKLRLPSRMQAAIYALHHGLG